MNLETKIKSLPNEPGCYLFKDNNGEVIYVGKAKNLKKRVASYFNSSKKTAKTNILVKKINDFDFVIAPTEIDSLLLESNLINKFEPKYNIKIKRGKTYPYVELTNKVPIELKISKKINKKSGSKFFGPFPDGFSAIKSIKILKEVLPLQKCLNNGNEKQECLNYQLGKCIGHCVKTIKIEDYEKHISIIYEFFSGKTDLIEKQIKEKIEFHSNNLQFELSIKLKDLLEHVKSIKNSQATIFNKTINLDFIGYFVEDDILSIVIKHIKFGKLSSSSSFIFKIYNSEVEEDIEQFLYDYYSNNLKPEFIFSNLNLDSLKQVFEIKTYNNEIKIQNKFLNISNLEAKEKIMSEREELERYSKKFEDALNNLKEELKISKLSEIEMVDISSLKGEEQVGVVINYKDGIFRKNLYRKYIIKTTSKMDDYHSIYETTYRHFRNKLLEKQQLPDLFVVDGKHQVQLAKKALDELRININVIGIIKDDKHKTKKIFLSEKKELDLIPKSNLMLSLHELQDEVHRYAISFHRNRKLKSTTQSVLHSAIFLTEKDINDLFKNFESIRMMKLASLDELKKIIGLPKSRKLINFLKLAN